MGLALDELKEEDKVVEVEGFKFAVERQIFNVFNHIEIDYTKNWLYKNYNIKYR